jgi:hypothetical protein
LAAGRDCDYNRIGDSDVPQVFPTSLHEISQPLLVCFSAPAVVDQTASLSRELRTAVDFVLFDASSYHVVVGHCFMAMRLAMD